MVIGRISVLLQSHAVHHIAHQRIHIARQLAVGALVNAFHPVLQLAYCLVVAPHAVQRRTLVVVKRQFGRVIQLTLAAGSGHLVHIVALQHNPQYLQARFSIVRLNAQYRVHGRKQRVVGHALLYHVVSQHLRHVAVLLRLRQRLSEQGQHRSRIAPVAHIVHRKATHSLKSCPALRARVEHHPVQQVKVERVCPRRLVVSQ